MKQSRSDPTSPTTPPDRYVEKEQGTIASSDLVWNAADGTFEPAAEQDVVGRPVSDASTVATPAYWVTYDETTGTVWGVGESPEESLQAAKFEAYGEDHKGVGYEFACWCEELDTKACTETLYTKASTGDRLSLSDERLREHILAPAPGA